MIYSTFNFFEIIFRSICVGLVAGQVRSYYHTFGHPIGLSSECGNKHKCLASFYLWLLNSVSFCLQTFNKSVIPKSLDPGKNENRILTVAYFQCIYIVEDEIINTIRFIERIKYVKVIFLNIKSFQLLSQSQGNFGTCFSSKYATWSEQ